MLALGGEFVAAFGVVAVAAQTLRVVRRRCMLALGHHAPGLTPHQTFYRVIVLKILNFLFGLRIILLIDLNYCWFFIYRIVLWLYSTHLL